MGQFFLKRDNLKLGLVVGLVTLLLGMVVFYEYKFSSISVKEFFFYIKTNTQLLTALCAICMVINIAVLTYYLNTKRDQTAKGIFLITALFGIGILVFKYLI